jgi:putative transposase
MMHATTVSTIPPAPSLETVWEDVHSSFERFCLTAGIGALEQMLREDAERLAGPRHSRNPERAGRRWGAAKGKIGFHGGKVDVRRPRVRSPAGCEVPLPSWQAAQAEDWLGRWAMNLMLINVSTRKFGRAVQRLPQPRPLVALLTPIWQMRPSAIRW